MRVVQMEKGPIDKDTRNIGLVGMSDGIPIFRDKHSTSVMPVMLRADNMGDELSMKFRYTHMTALVPAHFWILSDDEKQFKVCNVCVCVCVCVRVCVRMCVRMSV